MKKIIIAVLVSTVSHVVFGALANVQNDQGGTQITMDATNKTNVKRFENHNITTELYAQNQSDQDSQSQPGDVPDSDADCYNFRLQAVEWDYKGDIGVQWSLAYHQYINSNGFVVTPDDPTGSWVPFIPGPTIRGEVGDIICVKIQNRIDVSGGQFIEHLMDDMVVHWHGLELANAYDGTPLTQAPIEPGTDYIYRFRLVRPGLFWYHPHWDSMIQNPLGANGALIVDDAVSLELRDEKVIPHEDRTFVLTLSDLSFQDDRGEAAASNYVPFADIAAHGGPVYIRDIMAIGGGTNVFNQNFGDAILVNGIHGYPFNDPLGNFQQFWHEGQRTNTAATVLKGNESVAFHVTNNGMHRFYKIHLAYKTSSSGDWKHSGALYKIGGEGGLLNEARQPNGIFNDGINGVTTNGTVVGWRLRGIQKRALSDDGEVDDPAGEGLQAVQESTEMLTGEFLLPTASRVMVAFQVDPSWVEVALRANGFSVINKGRAEWMIAAGLYWEDEAPEDLVIAIFDVDGIASGQEPYVLTDPIEAGTELRANDLIDPSEQLEDLRDTPEADVITNFPWTRADLEAAGVMVTTNEIMQDYDITLTGQPAPGFPSINSINASWDDTGPFQSTYANTRYVQKDAVVEWTVETQTDSADHPWHLHGFSFQPIRIELRTGTNSYGEGIYETLYEWDFVEYQDVIYVPAYHRVTYRFKVEDRDFVDTDFSTSEGGVYGRWLAHCHIFKHAHKGMMMEFIVVDETNSLSQRRFPTDIYLRDNVDDDGAIPSSGSISASPDIILRPSLVTDAAASWGGTNEADNSGLGYVAAAGQDNYIYVRNKNKGYEDATEVTTDVYWSEVSTLVTPDHWNYIDTTDPVDIPTGDGLVVADPITWLEADIPAEGHYCFVGIAGNLHDPKTLTQAEVSGFDVSGMTWEEYHDLIRGNNNVTWRNFNVIDMDLSFAWGPFCFNFRGAFDIGDFNQNRAFDLVLIPPPGFVLSWKIPKAPRGAGPGTDTDFTEALAREIQQKQLTVLNEGNDFFLLKITEETLIENLPLQKSASYDSELSLDLVDNANLMGDVANIIDKEMFVGQVYKFPTGDYEVGRVSWKFITLPEDDQVPPAAIGNLTVVTETDISIQLNWTATGDDGTNGTAAGYDMRYSTSPINDDIDFSNATQVANEPFPQVSGSPESHTISGLSQKTTYYVAIKARDNMGNAGDLSNVASTTTRATPHSAFVDFETAGAETQFVNLTNNPGISRVAGHGGWVLQLYKNTNTPYTTSVKYSPGGSDFFMAQGRLDADVHLQYHNTGGSAHSLILKDWTDSLDQYGGYVVTLKPSGGDIDLWIGASKIPGAGTANGNFWQSADNHSDFYQGVVTTYQQVLDSTTHEIGWFNVEAVMLIVNGDEVKISVTVTEPNQTTHSFSWTDSGDAAVVDAGRIGLSVSGVRNIPGQFDNFNALNLDEGFKIRSISVSPAGGLTIEWNDVGLNYTVQETTSLLFPTWTPAAGSWPVATGAWSGAASPSNRATFYRVVGQE